jgi:YesN/AraC family two-component response regulator
MDHEKAKSLGINDFAYKPISKKDIAKLIRKVLGILDSQNIDKNYHDAEKICQNGF